MAEEVDEKVDEKVEEEIEETEDNAEKPEEKKETKPKKPRLTKKYVEDLVVKLAKERNDSAKIGIILRDEYGIPSAKVITGKPVSRIMKENELYPEMPEDMLRMLKKAVNLRNHLEGAKPDKHSLRGLERLESRIRRLGKYYVRKGEMPKGWKYSAEEAKLIVEK